MSKLHMNASFDHLKVTLTLGTFAVREINQAIKDELAGLNRVTVLELLEQYKRKLTAGKRHVNAR